MRTRSILIAALLLTACSSGPEAKAGPPVSEPEALYNEGMEDLGDGYYPEALKAFGDVKTKFPYSKWAALADLRTADTHFERGKFIEAIDAYRTFLKLHPNHDESAYAMLRIGDAYAEQIPEDWWFLPPSAEKDQANTRLAIGAYHDMLSRFGQHALAEKAKDGVKKCRTKLAEHEMYVAKFYFGREKYKASASRAEGLLASFPELGLDEEALFIAGKSRFLLLEVEVARPLLERLVTEFPAGEHRAEADALLAQIPAAPATKG